MNDPELFELCKEVYKRFPEWNDTRDNFLLRPTGLKFGKPDRSGFQSSEATGWAWVIGQDQIGSRWAAKEIAPLYTSDYLLEKLPASIASREYPGEFAKLEMRKEDGVYDNIDTPVRYFAWYSVVGIQDVLSDFGESADTPLKALLKLVLALDDAGVKLS